MGFKSEPDKKPKEQEVPRQRCKAEELFDAALAVIEPQCSSTRKHVLLQDSSVRNTSDSTLRIVLTDCALQAAGFWHIGLAAFCGYGSTGPNPHQDLWSDSERTSIPEAENPPNAITHI